MRQRLPGGRDPRGAAATTLALVSDGDGHEKTPDVPARAAPVVKLRRLDVARMLTTEPAPVDWLIEGVAARGALTLLAGREKEGKSMIALAIGACVLSGGGSVAGLACRAGRVLIVDAENGESEAHRRVRALGLDSRHVENIEYVEPRGFDLRGDLRELDRLLERSRSDLCILDSFRTLWGGEENSSGDVAGALDPLRALLRDRDVAGVLIHHLGRRGGEYRGSSAIGASVENLLELARVEGDPDRRRRRLRNSRCRFEEEAPDRWLTIEADRRLGALFIEEAEPYEAEDAPPSVRAPVRASLAARLRERLTDTPQRLADLCRAEGLDTKDASARRALAALAAGGEAEQVENGWRRVSSVSAPRGRDTLTPDTPPGEAAGADDGCQEATPEEEALFARLTGRADR